MDPIGKLAPEPRPAVCVTVTPASVAVGAAYVTTALVSGKSMDTETLPGTDSTGFVVSTINCEIVRVLETLPTESVMK